MDNISRLSVFMYVGFVVLLCALVFAANFYRHRAENLQAEIDAIKTASDVIVSQKTEQVNLTEKRAREFLENAKNDYNRLVSDNHRLRDNGNSLRSNPLPEVQKTAGMVETDNGKRETALDECAVRYRTLWDSWDGLCLIYGCEE